MAALIVESARSAREESQRLRADSWELRRVMRSSARIAETRMTTACATAALTRVRLAVPMGSPWSSLAWLREDEELCRVLVSVE
jgi:hypothetical protein